LPLFRLSRFLLKSAASTLKDSYFKARHSSGRIGDQEYAAYLDGNLGEYKSLQKDLKRWIKDDDLVQSIIDRYGTRNAILAAPIEELETAFPPNMGPFRDSLDFAASVRAQLGSRIPEYYMSELSNHNFRERQRISKERHEARRSANQQTTPKRATRLEDIEPINGEFQSAHDSGVSGMSISQRDVLFKKHRSFQNPNYAALNQYTYQNLESLLEAEKRGDKGPIELQFLQVDPQNGSLSLATHRVQPDNIEGFKQSLINNHNAITDAQSDGLLKDLQVVGLDGKFQTHPIGHRNDSAPIYGGHSTNPNILFPN